MSLLTSTNSSLTLLLLLLLLVFHSQIIPNNRRLPIRICINEKKKFLWFGQTSTYVVFAGLITKRVCLCACRSWVLQGNGTSELSRDHLTSGLRYVHTPVDVYDCTYSMCVLQRRSKKDCISVQSMHTSHLFTHRSYILYNSGIRFRTHLSNSSALFILTLIWEC